jgi:hypothetical protein
VGSGALAAELGVQGAPAADYAGATTAVQIVRQGQSAEAVPLHFSDVEAVMIEILVMVAATTTATALVLGLLNVASKLHRKREREKDV